MKTAMLGLCLLGVLSLSSVAQAQCGCMAMPMAHSHAYAPMMQAPMAPAPMAHAPMSRGPASIAFINRLDVPIPRDTYTLQYAIHLTDGRILLSDNLPAGHSVRGVEHQAAGGRRVNAIGGGPGNVIVRDPSSNQTIARF